MKYLKIQSYNSELEVARISIGTSSRISSLSDEEVFRLFDIYFDAGGNCIDSARGYYGGKSEELIGRWQISRGIRNRILLCTKAGNSLNPGVDSTPRLSYPDLEDDLNGTLKAFRTDCIDIFWLHRDDPSLPVEEIMESVNKFIKAGKVRMVGCSNWVPERIEAANNFAKENGMGGFLASQIRWSLAFPGADLSGEGLPNMDSDAYDWYAKHNFPVFAFSSQAMGFFAKAAAGGLESLSDYLRGTYITPDNLKRLENVKRYAAEHNTTVTAASLGYLLCNKVPSVAIITSKSPEQLQESLGAIDVEMTPEEADSLFYV